MAGETHCEYCLSQQQTGPTTGDDCPGVVGRDAQREWHQRFADLLDDERREHARTMAQWNDQRERIAALEKERDEARRQLDYLAGTVEVLARERDALEARGRPECNPPPYPGVPSTT